MADIVNMTKADLPVHPYTRAAVITPNDGADLAYVTRAIKAGTTGGNIAVIMLGQAPGATPVVIPIAANEVLPIRVRRVMATNTTASPLVAFW